MSVIDNSYSQTLDSRLEEIPILADRLVDWGAKNGVSGKVINCLNLMLDELITNIVKHGYKSLPDGKIELHIKVVGQNIETVLTDYGPPFNLLENPEPDIHQDLDERAIGGLGVHFVRRLSDQIYYRRIGNANEVRLIKSDTG